MIIWSYASYKKPIWTNTSFGICIVTLVYRSPPPPVKTFVVCDIFLNLPSKLTLCVPATSFSLQHREQCLEQALLCSSQQVKNLCEDSDTFVLKAQYREDLVWSSVLKSCGVTSGSSSAAFLAGAPLQGLSVWAGGGLCWRGCSRLCWAQCLPGGAPGEAGPDCCPRW